MLVILLFLLNFLQILMIFFIHSCFIRFDLAGNEDVYDVKLEVNDENKFDNPQNGMLSHFILHLIFFKYPLPIFYS